MVTVYMKLIQAIENVQSQPRNKKQCMPMWEESNSLVLFVVTAVTILFTGFVFRRLFWSNESNTEIRPLTKTQELLKNGYCILNDRISNETCDKLAMFLEKQYNDISDQQKKDIPYTRCRRARNGTWSS